MVFYWEKLLNFLTGANLGLLTSAVKFFPRPKNFFHLRKGTWKDKMVVLMTICHVWILMVMHSAFIKDEIAKTDEIER